MRRSKVVAALSLVILLIGQAARTSAEDAKESDQGAKVFGSEELRQSIEAGTKYLLAQQKSDGSWTDYAHNETGVTALATLALLHCGELPKTNLRLAKAINYLCDAPLPRGTYALSLQIMVFCRADPVRHAPRISELVKILAAIQITEERNKGGWHYGRMGDGDSSNTHFAMLALHEAALAGFKVDERTWRQAERYWLNNLWRKADGSWSYFDSKEGVGGMTCAGVASLVIARSHIGRGDARVEEGKIVSDKLPAKDDAMEKGMAWLGKNFSAARNPEPGSIASSFYLYYVNGLEEVGRFTGRRFLGAGSDKHDWFREVSQQLLEMHAKSADGSWLGKGPIENKPVIATAFALLFLSRGSRPVVVAKLQTSAESDDWDLHSAAIPNLTRRVEKTWKQDLSWQIVDISRRSDDGDKPLPLDVTVAEMLDAPVLFLSGSQGLRLDEEQRKMLGEYVSRGGFLFAEACHGDGRDGAQFDRDFRNVLKQVFPQAKLGRLAPSHAIWPSAPANAKNLPKKPDFELWGLDVGGRTAVVYSPRSLSCRWELCEPRLERDIPQNLKDEIESCVQLGERILAYATKRELKGKLDQPRAE